MHVQKNTVEFIDFTFYPFLLYFCNRLTLHLYIARARVAFRDYSVKERRAACARSSVAHAHAFKRRVALGKRRVGRDGERPALDIGEGILVLLNSQKEVEQPHGDDGVRHGVVVGGAAVDAEQSFREVVLSEHAEGVVLRVPDAE